jgi:NAD(P)-dependent dehydrogenase (short-subunit alcohol dehydrogenase family)
MEDKAQELGILEGQVAVVTGSTRGIGAGIVRMLAGHGARVVLHGLEKEAGEKGVADIEAAGGEAMLVVGDLKDEVVCRCLIEKAIEHFGRIDILVNNAAVVDQGNIETTSTERWDRIFDTNVRAAFILCREAVKHMKERRSADSDDRDG